METEAVMTYETAFDYLQRGLSSREAVMTYETALHWIADHYGKRTQLHQLMEECCELALEASHSVREKGLRVNLISEIADVDIMIDQIRYLFDIADEDIEEVKREKIERQLDRIAKEKIKEKKTNEND